MYIPVLYTGRPDLSLTCRYGGQFTVMPRTKEFVEGGAGQFTVMPRTKGFVEGGAGQFTVMPRTKNELVEEDAGQFTVMPRTTKAGSCGIICDVVVVLEV